MHQLSSAVLFLAACATAPAPVPDTPPVAIPDPVLDAGPGSGPDSRFKDCQNVIDALRTDINEQCLETAADCAAGLRCVGVEDQ